MIKSKHPKHPKQSFPKPIDTRNIISESKESILRYGTVNPLAPKPETEDRTTQAMGQFYLFNVRKD